jgi:REP-associated tyrosine transposase
MPDQVHMMISIPPKFAVLGSGGVHQRQERDLLARVCGERKQNFVGQHFGRGLHGVYGGWG